ncbi:MAG: ComF family protein [Thermoplasmata archaeon]|nr:ComF family protein [Thermoplasmata archaeon]
MTRRLLAAALPLPRCAACDGQVVAPDPLCAECTSTLLPVCSDSAGATAAFVYVGAVARALGRLKTERRAELARPLGDLLWASLEPRAGELRKVAVVPVPLHPVRLAERGFNQSGLLARRVARRLGAPLWPSALTRVRDTPRQATLRRAARIANVENAFMVREPEHVAGRSVLLVDDVWTTGATLEACARVLLEAGARAVFRSVLARAGY